MSTTYSITRDQLITKALIKQGWLDYTAPAPATKVTQMADSLNIMIKAWASEEIKLWCVEQLSLPLVAGQLSYTIGPTGANLTANRPLRITDCNLRMNSTPTMPNDIPLQRLSRQEYVMLGSKLSQGTPNSFYYDPQLGNGVLYLYLTPAAYDATNNLVKIWSNRQVLDMSSGTATFDFPQEWYQALLWGLADETSLDNQIPEEVADRIAARAKKFKDALEDWDREDASVYMQPDVRMAMGMRRR